jgi:ADP-heptose:LPS heptosyltransferase
MSAGGEGVLVIHPGALGDVLQAVPALRALGDGARVTFCGQPRLGEVLAGARVVADATSFDGFGLEILFTPEPASSELTGRLGGFARVVSWFGSRDEHYPERLRALAPSCVVAPPLPAGDGDTVWQHLLATLGRPPSAESAHRVPLALPESWRDRARRALDEVGARRDKALLVVQPGAGSRWKVAPADLLARVIAPVVSGGNVQVLLHAGPADARAAAQLLHAVESPMLTLESPPLPVLAGVLSMAQAYLGGDSGVSHLAAAVGAPAVILFPSATRRRWAPWSPTARPLAMEPGAAAGLRVAAGAAAALAEAISAGR